MDPAAGTSSERALNAFLRKYVEDRSSGRSRSLAEYQADDPAHAAIIAEWWARNASGPDAADTGGARALPERIGPYRIVRELGRGGQGVAYLAEDERLRRRAAVKVLTGLGALTPDRIARFLREAVVASRLNHPGIAMVYEVGIDAGTPFIAMQYVEGQPLSATIGNDRDCARAVRLAEGAARALHAAHEAGIVHRDVKPGNILVAPGGDPVIVDFGLAHDADSEFATLTRSEEFFGTPAYMAPEQLGARAARADRRADVWALGVTLYEAVAGRRPFDAPTREQLYRAILDSEPEDLRRANPEASADLAAIVETALAKEPDRRYRTAAAMADDLAALQAGRPVSARRVGTLGRLRRWARREPAKAALVALTLVTLPTIAAFTANHLADREKVEAARKAASRERRDEMLAHAFFDVGEGDPRAATRVFEEALALDGGSPEAAIGLAIAALRSKQPSDALAALDANAALLGELRAASVVRAAALRDLGRNDEAEEVQARAGPRRDAVDDYLDAEWLLQAGHQGHRDAYREAMDRSLSAIFLAPGPRSTFFQCAAHAASHLRDHGVARAMAEALRRHWPRSAPCTRWAGLALNVISPNEAIPVLREAVALDPRYADGWLSLGVVLREAGRSAEAADALRNSLRLRPGQAAAQLELGVALRAAGRRDEALAAFEEALRLRPGYSDARVNVGLLMKEKGHVDEAIAAYLEALRADRENPQTHNNLGSAYYARGRIDEAIASYREALRLDPAHADASNNLTVLLVERKRYAEAIETARSACAHGARGAGLRFSLGLALTEVGRYDEAIEAYQEAIRLDPGYAEAHCNLSRPLLETGRLAAALDAVRHGHELGQRRPGWSYPSARWVAHLEGLVDAEEHMLDVAEGRSEAGGASDLLGLADLAARTKRFDLALKWYGAAFDADAAFLSPAQPWALKAARAAIRAAFPACDASRPVNEPLRGANRALALGWLERALRAQGEIGGSGGPRADASGAGIAAWISEPALAPVRDAEWVAALPPDEAKRWTALWAEARKAVQGR